MPRTHPEKNPAKAVSATPAKPASELEAHLGFWLRFVSNHVSGRFQRLMEDNGVSVTEWVALRQICAAKEAAPAQLIAALGMTKGAVSKIVDRLETRGLVQRKTVEQDARARVIVLTESGEKLVPHLASLADQNDEAFFGHLSRAERDALMKTLKTLVQFHQLKQVPLE
jgi:DNA-binding MarR family transcriptional regulator